MAWDPRTVECCHSSSFMVTTVADIHTVGTLTGVMMLMGFQAVSLLLEFSFGCE